jgi:membrane-bound lytic murein transglycosylase A
MASHDNMANIGIGPGVVPGAARWGWRLSVVAVAWLLAACGGPQGGFAPGPQSSLAGPQFLTLAPGDYRQMPGWSDDTVAAALPAFLNSCVHIMKHPDGAPLDPAARAGADFGQAGDWRPLCREAAALPPGDDGAARRFFESRFMPVLARNGNSSIGLFTAYWEVEISGSRQPQGPYQVPVYRRPPQLASLQPLLSRAAIDNGALAARGLELVYLAERAELLALQTQGSGQVHLTDGSTIRLVYDGDNGRAAGHEPKYVFFKEHHGDGPIGAQGAVLTPGRSLAVDRRFIPLGVPLWLEARDRATGSGLRHLVIAQDTGNGIEGPVRGDYFWGRGPRAAAIGSHFLADGRYWLLLPRNIAGRLLLAAR